MTIAEKVHQDQNIPQISVSTPKGAKFYTSDRYALYLQGVIGTRQDSFPKCNLDDYDEWITLWRFIKVKAIALAQKGEDVYLTVAEYWSLLFFVQFIGCLCFVSLPSRECFFWFRFIWFSVCSLVWLTFVFWIFMNLRFDQFSKPWVAPLKISVMIPGIIQRWIAIRYCRALNVFALSFSLLFVSDIALFYVISLQVYDLPKKERLISSIQQSWSRCQVISFFSYGIILIFDYSKVMFGTLFLVGAFLEYVSQVLQVLHIAQKYDLTTRIYTVFVRIINFIALIVFLMRLDVEELDSVDYWQGITILFILTIDIFIAVNTMCWVSTNILLFNLDRDNSEHDQEV
eukprot:TRINITY_DN3314_c0_g1_i2.p1 TRINITY_DN3314_c0_g1~~TRINITY_DN3314_c0_g1_i2.p1  ORF type:complete len:344 (+),score=2.99 TRINITY_DN3314_c0_g1_i2:213-1244(+)